MFLPTFGHVGSSEARVVCDARRNVRQWGLGDGGEVRREDAQPFSSAPVRRTGRKRERRRRVFFWCGREEDGLGWMQKHRPTSRRFRVCARVV